MAEEQQVPGQETPPASALPGEPQEEAPVQAEPKHKPADFSEELYSSSNASKKAGRTPPEEDGYLPQGEALAQEPLPDLPTSAYTGQRMTAASEKRPVAKALNGISWKKKHRLARRDMITLNNGEPLSFALRKISVELIVILLFAVVIIGILFGREFLTDMLTDDTIGTVSTSTRYAAPQAVALESTPVADSPGYACIQMLGGWAGVPVDENQLRKEYGGRDITGLADGMEKELARVIANKTVTRKENLSNFTLITKIYESLQNGAPVLLSCTAQDGKTLTWALATSINAKQDEMVLCYSDGSPVTLTLEGFLERVRYEGQASKSLGMRLALVTGLHNKNTAFFFTPMEE